jgi:hypothetical protein
MLEFSQPEQHSLLQLLQVRLQRRLDQLQVLLGGDVLVDRIENFGGDALGRFAIDIRIRESVGQR